MGFYIIVFISNILILICYKLYKQNQKVKFNNLKISMIIIITFYLLINLYNIVNNIYINYKLMSFDIDRDGIFSIGEQTPEQNYWMDKYINDLGRNLLPIISGIYSIICFPILIIIGKIFDKLKYCVKTNGT